MRRGSIATMVVGLAVAARPASAPADTVDDVKPWLGITFGDIEPTIRVSEVFPRTAAARAGVLPGDEIVEIDDDPVRGGFYLREVVKGHAIGDRVRVTVLRDGRELTLSARLTAKPRAGELVELRLLGAPLPPMALDQSLDGRPALLTVFDARCEVCSAPASALAELASDRGLSIAVRTVVIGGKDEIASYLARNPVVGGVARWSIGPEEPRGTSVLSGLNAERGFVEGAILVVDAAGVVQFAASTADLSEVAGGALAAAARVQQRWRHGNTAW